MKKKLLFCLFVLIGLVAASQSDAEIVKFTKTYNIKNINNLKYELYNKYLERETRIESYLKGNKTLSRKYKSKDKTYEIYDIIDGRPIYRTTHNLNSAKATKTDKLQTGGSLELNLEGINMKIGVWDAESVRGTHDEFKGDQTVPQSRVEYPEFPGAFSGPISDHATHVAGTLIGKGSDANAKGMSPKATLRSFDWILDDGEALNEASNGLLISNHSYGVPIFSSEGEQQITSDNIGSYSEDAQTWDKLAFISPYYLAVNSAGNEGTNTYSGGLGSGYDKLVGNKNAKNNLVVANANPILNPSGALVILAINSSSSQGPTDDFRIKPDIAADGTNVYSSTAGSDTDYSTYSGTSMASPNTAGTLLLLQEYYHQLNSSYMMSATLKGLVCHTAIDDTTKPGPDPVFGWGLLNAEVAANTIKNDINGNSATIKEITLNDGETYIYQFSSAGSGPISATICWTDPAGIVSSSPNNILTPRLVNDLDLRLEDVSSTVFMPWKLDSANVAASAIKGDNTVDNIENIDISSSVSGDYTLKVSHKGSLTNGSQAFSLILTGTNLILGVSDKLISNVLVWPNPTDEKLNLSFNTKGHKFTVSLYDLQGRKIFSERIETILSKFNHSINTKGYNSGVYFLNIQSGSIVYNQKIIIN